MIRQTQFSPRAARLALPAALFIYTFTIRIWGITRHFWMHDDQIRDWRIALGPFSELPLVGPVTHLGGSPPGPAFYWVLWLIRVTVGPWFDDLPHAGGMRLQSRPGRSGGRRGAPGSVKQPQSSSA